MNLSLAKAMLHQHTALTGLALCLLLAFILSSCNNSIERRGIKADYSIYGVLRLKADTNYIRVKNLNVPLVLETKHTLNATVHLKNMAAGHSQLLTEDNLITFEGAVTHNLVTTMTISPTTTYKVIVKRKSDGYKETAKVTTPLPTQIKISPRVDSCGTHRTVTFENILTGETVVSYVSADLTLSRYNRKKSFYLRKRFIQFPGVPGRIFSHSTKLVLSPRICRCLGTHKVYIYSAIYGPGFNNDKLVIPDSITNVDRFLNNKLASVYIDTLRFIALTKDTTSIFHKPDTPCILNN